MSEESERIFLSKRVSDVVLGLPCRMPNIAFTVPKADPYGEFFIMGGDYLTVGGEGKGLIRNRYIGLMQLNIFVPEGRGTTSITKTGDRFKAMFAFKQGRDSEGDTYRFKGLQRLVPGTTTAGWATSIYRIAFTRDAVEPIDIGMSLLT